MRTIKFPVEIPKGRFAPKRGASSLGCILFLILVIVLGYLGFVFGEAYWSYYRVREKVRESLVWAVSAKPKTDQEITRQVIINALDVGVNLTPRNIRLSQSADTLTIRVIWVRELNLLFTFYDKSFEVSLTDVKRWQGGGLVVK
jgi:hypothetical protein